MRLFFVFIAFILSLNLSGQTNYVVVLWDVTWSMKGCTPCANPNPNQDIWDETKEGLKNIINNQKLDGSVTLEIMPFDDWNSSFPSYEPMKYTSFNENEKSELLDWVDNFDIDEDRVTGTDICGAVDRAYEKVNSFNAQSNRVYLLTDGAQSEGRKMYNNETSFYDADQCFCNRVREFCNRFCTGANESGNKLLVLELQPGTNTCDFSTCGCVDEVSVGCPGKFGYGLSPIIKNYNKTIKKSSMIEIVVDFEETLDSDEPKGFSVTSASDSRLVQIESNYSNGEMIIQLDASRISPGSQETFRVFFSGSSDDDCYNNENITIEDIWITITNKEAWEISIPDGGIKSVK